MTGEKQQSTLCSPNLASPPTMSRPAQDLTQKSSAYWWRPPPQRARVLAFLHALRAVEPRRAAHGRIGNNTASRPRRIVALHRRLMRHQRSWCLAAGLVLVVPSETRAQQTCAHQTDLTVQDFAARRTMSYDAVGP